MHGFSLIGSMTCGKKFASIVLFIVSLRIFCGVVCLTAQPPTSHAPRNAMIRPINGLSMVNQRPMLVTKTPWVLMSHSSFVKLRLAALRQKDLLFCSGRVAVWSGQCFVVGGCAPG